MHAVPLLINIAVALAYALAGGVVARRAGLPTIVGYLCAGVALGPFTPGYSGDIESIQQLAELGVILLMFGIGLHFSLQDLWLVRDIAVPGALIQMGAATAVGYWLALHWGWSPSGALVLGLSISVASTVVLLRGLMDLGVLETPPGRVAVGWLVLEDLATVGILVLLPAVLSADRSGGWVVGVLAFAKAAAFIALMLFVGTRVIPVALRRIAGTESHELFVLAALTLAIGIALASAEVFGVSLALGAFVAGVVVAESPYSHQISADLLPFRDAFAVLFFVSVGMLVNPGYLWSHWREVAALTALVVVGKSLIAVLLGFVFPYPARTMLIVAAGLSQIGEFSFIVGQAGLSLGVLDQTQYSLILAGSIVSITLNPWMFRIVAPTERLLKRWPRVWEKLNHHGPETATPDEPLSGHVVIVGCGRVGRHVAETLGRIGVPRLIVEVDPTRTTRLQELGVPVLFGDAANSEILSHTSLSRAKSLVVTVGDDVSAQMIVSAGRRLGVGVEIIVRASTWAAARRLKEAGATDVIRPELEGGIAIVQRTLAGLGFSSQEIARQTETIREAEIGGDDRNAITQ